MSTTCSKRAWDLGGEGVRRRRALVGEGICVAGWRRRELAGSWGNIPPTDRGLFCPFSAPACSAPELSSPGALPCEASDVYAWAAVLLGVLGGSPAGAGQGQGQGQAYACAWPPLPAPLRQLLAACLADDAADRPTLTEASERMWEWCLAGLGQEWQAAGGV